MSSLSPKSLDFVDKISEILSPVGQIIPYGSRMMGISTSSSDIDLALIVSDGYDNDELSDEALSDIIQRAVSRLRQYKAEIVNVFDKAKVLIIRAVFQGQKFDVVINGSSGVICTWLIQDMVRDNPLALKVITTVKEWAKSNEVVGADKGRLGSHALTVFTLHYLVTMRVVGLPHLDNDERGQARSPIWTSQELNQYASRGANRLGPRDNLWWLGKPKRNNPRFSPSFKMLVRGV